MSRRSMTRDIHESIRMVLGRNIKVLLKAPVKLELKGGDKTENRIIVFSAHRLFVMTAKVPTKIDLQIHYLDLRHIESKRSTHIAFTYQIAGSDKTATINLRPNEETSPNPEKAVDEMIVVLVSAVKKIYPGVPVQSVIGKIELKPSSDKRLVDHEVWKDLDPKIIGPCGGFSAQYACMCDYFSLPFREEVAWDVDTIYFSHDSHEMCLQDFEHLDNRDLVCIIAALEHNTWFTKLKATGNAAKMSSDLCDRIFQVVGKSSSLQELHVSAVGARWEFAAKLSYAVSHNPSSALTSFDLSYNFLEDKGLNHLSPVIAQHSKGLHHVNLSCCNLTGKGISHFATSLATNPLNFSTLTYLNLAGNSIKEDSHALCSFLAQPNVVAILDISGAETPLDILFGALVRGCTSSLTHLNLSRNPFNSKKSKEIPGSFKQFFATTLSLQYVNLSNCKIPPEAVKNLLLGLACNENTSNVELNLSNNNLGAPGATVIESCIAGVRCVSRLDLSENNIDAEMAGVMQGIMKSRSVLSLNVSRNMTGVKSKYLTPVMESIVQLIQDEEGVLQKLNLSDCKLKSEINNVINALGSNQSLQHLDITGNLMGDVGARLLAKALQINTRLRIINLDRNGITLQGYTDITYALQSNYALRHIPFPTFDLQPFVKTHPERVDAIIHRMQELLQRNASPHRFRNTAQAFRLTQGFLMSSTQQILDRVSSQTQDSIDTLLKQNPDKSTSEDVVAAKGMINDAENSKHLLSALHEVTSRGSDVDHKLKQVSQDLSNFVTSHVHKNVDLMLGLAERQCPTVLSKSHGRMSKVDLRSACQKKCQVPSDFMSGLITDQLGMEIHNKINELNLIIANHISDRIIDEVIEGLGAKSKAIVSEVGSLKKKRSLTPDILNKGRSSSLSESVEHETTSTASGDATSQKSESSPLSTPQTSKRISLHGRKLRPKSTADGYSSNQSKEDVTVEEEQRNAMIVPNENTEDTVPELPSSAVLQHLGKARPKRAKRYAPSRGAVVSSSSAQPLLTLDGSGDEDALSRFYTSSANNSFSPLSTPSDSPMIEEKSPLSGKKTSISSGTKSPELKENKKHRHGSGKETSENHDHEKNHVFKTHAESSKSKLGSGLSCLAASEEGVSTTESPEKRSLSPSLQSLSDIFHRKGHSSGKSETKSYSPSVISPFSGRRADSDGTSSKTRSGSSIPFADETVSSDDARLTGALSPDSVATLNEGKKTPEGVVKRHGIGHGGNLNLMAEIKEKRASMVTKTITEEELSPNKTSGSNENDDGVKGVFSHVKLRSTGLAGNLGSPTVEYGSSAKSSDCQKEENKGSIVGLRAFSTAASTSTTSTSVSSATQQPSHQQAELKPKPLPKPRPWSIVGVDRKSGEMTSVSGSGGSPESKSSANPVSSIASSVAANRKSSVRDMINNMNKAGSSESPSESVLSSRRKGSSLPRGTIPPSSGSEETKRSSSQGSGSASGSPKIVTKRSESTNDDPRILKLDDDFSYDDVLDV